MWYLRLRLGQALRRLIMLLSTAHVHEVEASMMHEC
jgi:hypothetical protein